MWPRSRWAASEIPAAGYNALTLARSLARSCPYETKLFATRHGFLRVSEWVREGVSERGREIEREKEIQKPVGICAQLQQSWRNSSGFNAAVQVKKKSVLSTDLRSFVLPAFYSIHFSIHATPSAIGQHPLNTAICKLDFHRMKLFFTIQRHCYYYHYLFQLWKFFWYVLFEWEKYMQIQNCKDDKIITFTDFKSIQVKTCWHMMKFKLWFWDLKRKYEHIYFKQ